jgi:hypothetical protein
LRNFARSEELKRDINGVVTMKKTFLGLSGALLCVLSPACADGYNEDQLETIAQNEVSLPAPSDVEKAAIPKISPEKLIPPESYPEKAPEKPESSSNGSLLPLEPQEGKDIFPTEKSMQRLPQS